MAESYTNVTVTGFNANPPSDDGTVADQNAVSWSKHLQKLAQPLKDAFDQLDTNVDAAFTTVEANTPAGMLAPYAGTSAPSGWLLSDGTTGLNSVTDPTLANLFAAIGTTYGGTSSADFALPNLQGRVVAGKEASATLLTNQTNGVNGETLGAVGGTETNLIAQANLPDVDLPVTDPQHEHPRGDASDQGQLTGGLPDTGWRGAGRTTGLASTGITVRTGGSDTPLNNVPPTIILNWIIKK